MVGVRFAVEQSHLGHRQNAGHDGVDFGWVTALGKIGHAFDQLSGQWLSLEATFYRGGSAGTDQFVVGISETPATPARFARRTRARSNETKFAPGGRLHKCSASANSRP